MPVRTKYSNYFFFGWHKKIKVFFFCFLDKILAQLKENINLKVFQLKENINLKVFLFCAAAIIGNIARITSPF